MRRIIMKNAYGFDMLIKPVRLNRMIFKGEEVYLFEYVDLVLSDYKYTTMLVKENGQFVHKPLLTPGEHEELLTTTLFNISEEDINSLPNSISLCSDLADKVDYSKRNSVPELLVYQDSAKNHDAFPYYLDRHAAEQLGFITESDYYHLSYDEYHYIEANYEIFLFMDNLGLGTGSPSDVPSFKF